MNNMKLYSSSNFMDAKNEIINSFLHSYDLIWKAIPNIFHLIKTLTNSLDNNFIEIQTGVFVDKTAKISNNATIIGPCIIAANAEIRTNAYIRENVYIGESTIIGNSSEIKNSIILDNAEIPHFNYVGDSILGNFSHLGAGAVISNFRQDRSNIKIHLHDNTVIDSDIQKLGAVIADHVEIGSNAVINSGTLIGKGSRVYPLTQTRGEVPANHILKTDNNLYPIITK